MWKLAKMVLDPIREGFGFRFRELALGCVNLLGSETPLGSGLLTERLRPPADLTARGVISKQITLGFKDPLQGLY